MAELPKAVPSALDDLGYVHLESCIGGDGVDLDIGAKSLYPGCQCEEICGTIACSCTSAYDHKGRLREEYFASTSAPVFECGSSCRCTSSCLGRSSQHQPMKELRVRRTSSKGLGVFTEVGISQGAFVGEYVGEVVSSTQAKHRLQSLPVNEACYVMIMREHVAGGQVLTTNVDATLKGNIMRNIVKGEELCFSYFGRCGAEAAASGELKVGKKQCFCESEGCIGFLPLEG